MRIRQEKYEKDLTLITATVTFFSITGIGLPAYAASIDLSSEPEYQWADIEIDFGDDEINDIDLYYGGSNVYTDVFDTAGKLEISETAVYDSSSEIDFKCDNGEVTENGTTSLLVECDANSGLFNSGYNVSQSWYFWERGAKFRSLSTISNTTGSDITLSAQINNNYGTAGTNSHYAYGNSTFTSDIPFGEDDDDTSQIVADDGRWTTHYEEDDAPIGVTWAGETVLNSGVVADYDDDDLDINFDGLVIPANDYIQIAVFYSWPVQTMIDANYTNDPTQPLSQANEAYLSISSMQSATTEEMFALISDKSRVVNWGMGATKDPGPNVGPIIQSSSAVTSVRGGEEVTLPGNALSSVISASVDGIPTELLSVSNNAVRIRIPELTSGVKDILITWSGGRLLHMNAFEVLEPLPTDTQKVNAGSFKGFVAVYARGYEGQRLSAKIGNDWVIVDPIVNNESANLARVTDFTGAGVDIQVRIYIDRVLMETIPLTTK